MKQQSTLSNVELVPAHLIFFGAEDLTGKFVAFGIVGDNDARPHLAGREIRTSLIEKIDIQEGTIETMNTIYKIV